MDLDAIVEARIHPAIGIARVGNAEDVDGEPGYFVGPELPYATSAPKGGYRDKLGRLKRQAARFRIYGIDCHGAVVGQLTENEASIEWEVHVANKKAAWYEFDVALDIPEASSVRSPRRNAQIQGNQREKLVIDPGPRTVSQSKSRDTFDTGSFFGKRVDLGEIRYEEGGNLLFLGGRGVSEPVSPDYTITAFANNSGWHDDVSDGPVSARVRLGPEERAIPVTGAWVVTGPPNYAPDLVATQPLYDVILDALNPSFPPPATSFTQHILPIFLQFSDAQWVNAGFAVQFGWRGLVDFTRPDFLGKLARAPSGNSDPHRELRFQVFFSFRNPNFAAFDSVGWPPLYGDAFDSFDTPPSPRVGFAITQRSYTHLSNWRNGNFAADYVAGQAQPRSIEDLPPDQQPDMLDHAALHFCAGGPFHPGVELTWPMRRFSLYAGKFRVRRRLPDLDEADYGDFLTADIALATGGPLSASAPGDLTKWMSLPWQADTAGCRSGFEKDFSTRRFIYPLVLAVASS
jgi:L-Lysine epsilon oxidase N-terminal/L-lysine epsilon oxidase C-terminal domain